MSTKSIQKRIKRVLLGAVLGGATMFAVPMAGCEEVVKEGAAARIFQGYGYIDADADIPSRPSGFRFGF